MRAESIAHLFLYDISPGIVYEKSSFLHHAKLSLPATQHQQLFRNALPEHCWAADMHVLQKKQPACSK